MRDLQTKLEDTVVDFKYKYYDHGRDVINMQNLMSLFKTNGFNDVESAFDNYFAPDKFKSYRFSGFKIMDYNNLSQYSINDNLEFWTESPCLIYYLETFSGFGSESLEEKWNIFLEKFIS